MLGFHRFLIVYVVAIPLALVLGYMAATPDMASAAVVGMVLFVLALPLLIQWKHWLLIFCWNSALMANFLPGSLPLWVVFAWLTFGLGVINHVMGHGTFLRAPELTKPILFLAAVVVVTAWYRGGLGLRVLGSTTYGGKKYFFILGAIIGYFALTSQPISMLKSARAVKWYYLSGLTYGLTNLIYAMGGGFFFLYYFLSIDYATGQAMADLAGDAGKRFGGLGPTATGLFCFILARWGIRGIFEWEKPWRLLLLAAVLVAGLYSGFRSNFSYLIALFAVQFMFEGLWRTPLLPIFAGLALLCVAPMAFFAKQTPPAVQRSLAFLPAVEISPDVRRSADDSTRWRLEMWQDVLPEVPKYLLIGKGYALDPTELFLTQYGMSIGKEAGYAGSLEGGDYHNGTLSVLMPFGIWGLIGFVWLLGAGVRVLVCNRRYGDARLKLVNTVMLSSFVSGSIFYFFVYGDLSGQLAQYLGILGMSVSLNRGVCRKPAVARRAAIPSALAAPVAAV